MAAPEYSKTAVTAGALCDALLYFDYVIPLFGVIEANRLIFSEARRYNDHAYAQLMDSVVQDPLPPDLRTVEFMKPYFTFSQRMIELIRKSYASGEYIEDMSAMQALSAEMNEFIYKFNLHKLPLCASEDFLRKSESEEISLTIPSLRLINTEVISLSHLAEFRRDSEAQQKLRRFRLFVYENYNGKNRAFIEDDIQKRLAEYEDAVKKWGFETKSAALTTIVDSKMVAGGIAGSFLTAYYHQPDLAIASGLLTAGITVGKIAVELGKQKFALRKLIAENPVSYIAYAKEKLEPKK